jgi:putative flippase GtrA
MADTPFSLSLRSPSLLIPKALRYAFIGASCALLDLVLFTLIVKLTTIKPVEVNMVTYAIGTLLSYYANARYNFKKNDKMKWRLLSFCMAAAFGLAISGFIISCADYVGLDIIFMKIISMGFVFLFQFTFNNFITFK